MPSLRDSGKLVGRSASVKQVARQCNLSFPLSLRQFISTPGCPFSRCNRLHIKVLTMPVPPPKLTVPPVPPQEAFATEAEREDWLAAMLSRMREIYSTAGIGVEVVSWENLTAANLGSATFDNLNVLDVGECSGSASDEQNELFQNQNNVPDERRSNEIVVYFVQSVMKTDGGTLNGCANFPNGQPGAVIAQIASQWTLAHEVGHVLGLNHISGEHKGCPASDLECCSTPDRTRLMTGCSTSNIIGTPTVDQTEINKILSSNLTHQC